MYSTFLTVSPRSVLFIRSNLLKRKDLHFSYLRVGLVRYRRNLRSSHLFSSTWHDFIVSFTRTHPSPPRYALTPSSFFISDYSPFLKCPWSIIDLFRIFRINKYIDLFVSITIANWLFQFFLIVHSHHNIIMREGRGRITYYSMYSPFLTVSSRSVLFSRSNLLKERIFTSCTRLDLVRNRRSVRSSHLFTSVCHDLSCHSQENW